MIERACRGLSDVHRLVFVNGAFQPSLSTLGGLPHGAVLNCLSAIPDVLQSPVEHSLGQYADCAQHAFTALNTACLQDVAVLLLAKGVVVEQPIHLLFLSVPSNQPTVSHPRVLVVTEASSQVTILESFVCAETECAAAEPYFTNSVTEMALGENADVTYCRLQAEREASFHIGTTQIQLAADARMDSHVISSGGKLARHELNVVFHGEGGECNLNGLAIARGRQLIDH